MNRNCINPHGIITYELDDMERETRHDRTLESEWVEEKSPNARWEYCTFRCPVQQRCRFYARYGR